MFTFLLFRLFCLGIGSLCHQNHGDKVVGVVGFISHGDNLSAIMEQQDVLCLIKVFWSFCWLLCIERLRNTLVVSYWEV